jgi:hypothetical protein
MPAVLLLESFPKRISADLRNIKPPSLGQKEGVGVGFGGGACVLHHCYCSPLALLLYVQTVVFASGILEPAHHYLGGC